MPSASPRPRKSLLGAMICFALLSVALAIGVALVSWVSDAVHRASAREKLTRINEALFGYGFTQLRFPAGAICAEDGEALLSWRVAILPFLGEENALSGV